tara:strand:- start:579 stop:1163 length:585 start_codon:yes stop_codon:yes gene_type:complete
MEAKLFLVVLGGRIGNSHIEQHDVRWVVGNTIDDTFDQLRKEWVGLQHGLHIDTYVSIRYIDGYEISLIKSQYNKINYIKNVPKKNNLWFVNIGGYNPNCLNEMHEFGLFVAKSSSEAKTRAKQLLLLSAVNKHNDNTYAVSKSKSIDNCFCLNSIQNWSIELKLDSLKRSQSLRPDWYGYRRLDNTQQLGLQF